MKIVSWNCASKFREKYTSIIEEDADIYVICECEDPARAKVKEYVEFAGDNYFWTGDLHYKGLGIFAKDRIKLEKLAEYCDTPFKNFIALRVNDSFNLLGVWAMPKYVEMIHDYFDANSDLFDDNLIICGDFNSNAIWNNQHKTKDSEGNAKDQTNLNKKLNKKGLFSAYHDLTSEKQGKETQYTFYLNWNLDKPYHIDYVYAAKDRVIGFKIGDANKWIELSDHVPITFEIKE
ncbi:endonuclease/exonuclease/phosphatase family protein [Methanobrevibacter sp. UBA188]|uniref:endonuclease/exonuclease/phosphatase family protein n=1 Tax=Methanobrevibacter sp. UBA188 TaxID=1915473 RepID=UPI0025CD142E|nr:endonuclease/exonuclease/phosphatase family protein [Methanobrevibacter sp. UBA188]